MDRISLVRGTTFDLKVSVLHNIVHLLFGIAGIVMARASGRSAYNYLFYGGIVYLVLFIYGIVIDKHSSANFVPVNSADDILHLALSAGMIGTAVALRSRRENATTNTAAGMRA